MPWEVCEAITGVPLPRDVAGRLREGAATLAAHPAAAARLLPFLIVALALPFVLRPLVTGTPPLPEPRRAPPCGWVACALASKFLIVRC